LVKGLGAITAPPNLLHRIPHSTMGKLRDDKLAHK
jgi:hypothetical protein